MQRSVETPIGDNRVSIKGSDVKRTTFGDCVLCGQYAQLELGHIVPRWAGKWLKDEGYVLGKYDSIGVETRSQDIEKHYMMCRSCENFLGAPEGYLANTVRGTPNDLALRSLDLVREEDDRVRLDNVDADLVLRALLGILFKAHLSPHHMYRHVRLPAWALTETIEALQRDVYPRERFSVISLKIMNLTVPDVNPRARINAHMRSFAAGVGTVFRFGGFVFVVHVGAIERFELEGDIQSLRTGDTSIRIGVGEFTYEPGIVPDDLFDAPRLPTGYVATDDRCPCGLQAEFGKCCRGRWLSSHARYLEVPNQATRRLDS